MYRVTHVEKYVLDETVTDYETVDDMKIKYSAFSDSIDEADLPSLKVGEETAIMYDFYINLYVTRIK